MKIILSALVLSLSLLFLTGCNTVRGAFQGAGQDTRYAAHELHLD